MDPYLIVPIYQWDIDQFMSLEGGTIYRNYGIALTNFYPDTLELKTPMDFSAEVAFYLDQLVTVIKDDLETIGHLYQKQDPIDVTNEVLNTVVSPNLQAQAYELLKDLDTGPIVDSVAKEAVNLLILAIKAKGYN